MPWKNKPAKLIRAESAGFCFGVSRAVDLAKTAAEGGAYALGAVIHNQSVVEELARRGLRVASSPEEIPEGATVLLRAHGERLAAIRRLEEKNCRIIDGTCPSVKRIHTIVEREDRDGAAVVIFGLPDHPEPLAIADRGREVTILSDLEQAKEYVQNHPPKAEKPLAVVAQTTADKKNWEKFSVFFKNQYTNAKIFDTICSATASRQQAAADLAAKVDAMIVIGDGRSANTARLYDICKRYCANVFLLSGAEPDNPAWEAMAGLSPHFIGLTAGASTPDAKIEEVINMSEEKKLTQAEAEAAEAIAAQAAEAVAEEEESFAEMVDRSVKPLRAGMRVTGIVTRITNTDVHVDLDAKQTGLIPVSELSDDPTAKVEDLVHVGDEIEVFVTKVNDSEGIVSLSKKRIEAARSWETIDQAREERALVEGTIVEVNKGGLVASVNGVRVFIPASHSGQPKEADLNVMLKQRVTLRITEVNRAKRRVIGSIRYAKEDQRKQASRQVWETIEVGNVYQGVVKSLMPYGAFIDIGGADGMAHVTELAWGRVKNPADVLAIGDTVTVRVIALDTEKHKISLSLKSETDNPWIKFVNTYAVDDIVDAKIVKLMQFGAFAEILPGVDGLIHISQITDHRIARPSDAVHEGDMVKVKILDINTETEKISLSIRATMEGAEAEEIETAEAETADAE